jgi:sugar lactone lactonase YvrE
MRSTRLQKLALLAIASLTLSLAACSSSAPAHTGVSAAAQAAACEVNPASAPMPKTDSYESVPGADRISVTMTGISSGTVTPGEPTEVEVTLCNNSPVDYPKAGVVFAMSRCTCATSPMGLPEGTADRFDTAAGHWVKLDDPVMGTGMDYLGGFTDVQPLPKGKSVTLKYRFAVDVSMIDGKGGVVATAVVPDPLVQIGKAALAFNVSRDGAAHPTGPAPTVLPFAGLTDPASVAVDAAGDVFVADYGNDRVLKLAAGSTDPIVLPFTGLDRPGHVAVSPAGDVYVSDTRGVAKLAAGAKEPTMLPFTDRAQRSGLTVDNAGNVYLSEWDDASKVLKLAAGSTEQTVLPIVDVQAAGEVGVDGAGNVYVLDGQKNRVIKLAAGSDDQTVLPLRGLEYPDGLAVNAAGDMYVVDSTNRQVVKFAAGSNKQTALPSDGLYAPRTAAVDAKGNVYVIDNGGYGRVVKLAAG